uniref:Uncharacterized protein LOC114343728 n=1 Tax=Diabrotica virgifera virgifera TaxID=50390 RepID=A0A6P7GY62_DIAVI
MLAKILDIGLDPPDSKKIFYQPIVFNSSAKNSFFLELFSRTMWLLSRTRREMKVSTIEDYPKLMRALKKQVKMVLNKRPLNFKELTTDMTNLNFDAVLKKWQVSSNNLQFIQFIPSIGRPSWLRSSRSTSLVDLRS